MVGMTALDASLCQIVVLFPYVPLACVVVLYPGRSRVERIMDVTPRGTELELQLRR